MTIPSFRRSATPRSIGREEGERDRKKERFRGSRHERGYDAEWTALSARYRKHVKGRCEECFRRGYQFHCDVVDHMIPIADRQDGRLDWNNLDALCHKHHNGLKRRMEDFARRTGQIELLPRWMKHPETRPAAFQIVKFGPLKGLLDEDQGEDRVSRV